MYGSRRHPQTLLHVLEFEYIVCVPLNVLESMGVFWNVLENVISTLYFNQILAIPTADDFMISCTCTFAWIINMQWCVNSRYDYLGGDVILS